jgi:hypothetical protein
MPRPAVNADLDLALVKYRLVLVSITLAVYNPFHILEVILSATMVFDTEALAVILPVRTLSDTSIFRMIRPLATKFPVIAILPGIVPIVNASNTLVFVKYKLLADSVTLAVKIPDQTLANILLVITLPAEMLPE